VYRNVTLGEMGGLFGKQKEMGNSNSLLWHRMRRKKKGSLKGAGKKRGRSGDTTSKKKPRKRYRESSRKEEKGIKHSALDSVTERRTQQLTTIKGRERSEGKGREKRGEKNEMHDCKRSTPRVVSKGSLRKGLKART